MKRFAFATIILLGLIISCAPTATPQPQVALATATAQVPTVTPTLTEAPTLTPTSTPTNIPTPTRTFTPTPVPTLPALYVDGAYIKRSDTRQIVLLKGLNVVDFYTKERNTFAWLYNYHGLKKVVEEKWGINLLRVAINPESVETRLPEIDKLVAFANKNGMYLILTPFPSPSNPARSEDKLPVPDDMVAEVMGRLAEHYKDKTNVLYGLWNEPHPETLPGLGSNYNKEWRIWLDAGINVAKAIRAKNPQSILVVPGGRLWARDLSYYKDHAFPFENIIYEVHDFWTPPDYPYNRDQWTWVVGKSPIYVGEFGGACCLQSNPPLQSDHDINYMQDLLRIVNNNPNLVHYTMWGLYNWDAGAIFQSSLQPTRRGKLLLEDLTNYPPTRFR